MVVLPGDDVNKGYILKTFHNLMSEREREREREREKERDREKEREIDRYR